MANIHHIVSHMMGGVIVRPFKRGRKEKMESDNYQQYPKMPSGFQCFVCGKQFVTNNERIQHLEEDPHGSLYDTISPQEREDNRRLKLQIE
ncbi:MAG: hypothetical protein M3297_13765 [Thermoproteota archaeon]|jgi:hypothetical protein|nr:hypothetical protein [Thermoproteota archaeon]